MFELNKEYPFDQIEAWAKEENVSITQYGEDCVIGETFLVVGIEYSDVVWSFVMTGYRALQGVFKLIYQFPEP